MNKQITEVQSRIDELERRVAMAQVAADTAAAAAQRAQSAADAAASAAQAAASQAQATSAQASQMQSSMEEMKARHEARGLHRRHSNAVSAAPSSGSFKAPNVVTVLYGTDRGRAGEPGHIDYTGERALRLELGKARVSVPKTHVPGKVERPAVILWTIKLPEDPARHFVISAQPRVLSETAFATEAKELALKGSALLYIHGYNQSFDAGLFRSAQLAYDFQIKGPVFYYSFPSRAKSEDYVYDRDSDDQAVPYLRKYLSLIFKQAGVKKVNIIAHSRGNDLLIKTLVLMQAAGDLPTDCCGQMILASPDVDRDYARAVLPTLAPHFASVTLYANDKDKALALSKALAGGVPRLGELQQTGWPVILAGMDSIDATAARQPFFDFNHDEYVDDSTLLADITSLIRKGHQNPKVRTPMLLVEKVLWGEYWKLPR